MFEDINLPIQHVDLACGNKNCRSQDKIGVCICLDNVPCHWSWGRLFVTNDHEVCRLEVEIGCSLACAGPADWFLLMA